jgi:hypothetical protein
LGEFYQGLRHGVGNFKTKNFEFLGQFLNGEFTGLGKVIELDSGDTHIGQFVHGEKNGFGILTYSNGDIYEGEW